MGKIRSTPGFADAAPLLSLLSPEIRPPKPALGVDGHRARLRARFLAGGPEAIAERELIEMTLFMALPRRDTKPLAWALLARFGSYAAAISASVPDLLELEGLGEAGVAALRLARAEGLHRPVLNNWDRLIEYLQAAMSPEKIEQFRVLFLDNRNRLMADEAQSTGTVNHTPVYPREVVKRALELHASAIILVHNHPSGDPSPSAEDIEMTREIKQAAQALGIVLHDHTIIGNGQWRSFRQMDYL